VNTAPTPLQKAVTLARQFKRDGVVRGIAEWSIANKIVNVDPGVAECFPVATKHVWDGVPLPEEVEDLFHDPLPEVPAVMKAKRQWVRWRLETVNGKRTKIPYQVNGEKASSSDPSTWTDYRTAVTGAIINHEQGVGFMFADGFAGIDLDGCRNPKTGETKPWADDIIQSLDNVYVEVSPSGTGLHIFVLGKVPAADKKFNLNPAIGYGKAAIEIYDERRYFTVTGNSYFEDPGDVVACDLTPVYQKFHELRRDNPVPRDERVEQGDAGEPTQAKWHGLLHCSKYDIFKRGEILSPSHPFVIDNRTGWLEYPSQSEADLAFCTILAIMHDGDADKIWNEYCDSAMARDKWRNREDDFRRLTIARAIESAKKVKSQTHELTATEMVQPTAAVPAIPASTTTATSADLPEDGIPVFDEGVITGVYKDMVDLVTEGTTIPKQFPFLAAKVFIGARLAGRMTFQNMDADSSYYGVVIAETGTGKGLAWRRTVENCLMVGESLRTSVKIIQSADSGAGLKDAFFDDAGNAITIPLICYVDEATSLGHKAGEKKNPEIADTIIELADGHRISRVLARNGKKTSRTNDNARLSVYMCGQNGEVFMRAFAGRTKLGLYDRFYPEYSPEVEAGDLPDIDMNKAVRVWTAINNLFSKVAGQQMKMADDVKPLVENFWKSQPKEYRGRVRWKKHLMLDMYMAAFGRGSMIATVDDWEIARRIYLRQVAIREKHFTTEVPDKIGVYNSRLRVIVERMRARLLAGESVQAVALSQRDFMTATNAYRDNDVHTFCMAWRHWEGVLLASVSITGGNGQQYKKFVPMPNEDEVWKMKQ
jgi:putative DNA primase/helicase